jgi:hypothetical protein
MVMVSLVSLTQLIGTSYYTCRGQNSNYGNYTYLSKDEISQHQTTWQKNKNNLWCKFSNLKKKWRDFHKRNPYYKK